MVIITTMNKELLKQMITEKLVSVQKHPKADLFIYNYSPRVQYERLWNEITLKTRGLILDSEMNIIARPFGKFFNLEEHSESDLPKLSFDVFDKMDGSLGILYWLNDVPYIATRGSFNSDQAIHGTEILYSKYKNTFNKLERDKTYLFEIIYPSKGDLGYHGIVNWNETSNDLRFSSIPKDQVLNSFAMIYNKDGYVKHCKDYNQYVEWLEKRNTQRYVDVNSHNQQIDGKNLLHCRRLLDTAIEIATEKTIKVKRTNADYLLKIRRGEIELQSIIDKAEADIIGLDEIYANSGLPEYVDKDFVNDLLLEIRHLSM